LNSGALDRHGIQLVREYAEIEPMSIDKHKVLQILVNLVRNAKHSFDGVKEIKKQITLGITKTNDRLQIAITDNGIGIPPENLLRIFNHGFTTKKNGHGFGLHSGALTARELGGTLTAFSEGTGRGSKFTLEFPITEEKDR
jgi:signal transduction histidine kinase